MPCFTTLKQRSLNRLTDNASDNPHPEQRIQLHDLLRDEAWKQISSLKKTNRPKFGGLLRINVSFIKKRNKTNKRGRTHLKKQRLPEVLHLKTRWTPLKLLIHVFTTFTFVFQPRGELSFIDTVSIQQVSAAVLIKELTDSEFQISFKRWKRAAPERTTNLP